MNTLLLSLTELEIASSANRTIPVPLLYLAASLRQASHNVSILDLATLSPTDDQVSKEFYFDAITEEIRSTQAGLVGINCFTSMHFSITREIAQVIKSTFPDMVIMIGGVHPTLFPRDILQNCPQIDYVVIGEGETQVAEIANINDDGAFERLSEVQALGFRDNNGNVVVNDRVSYIEDLDKIPMAAWDEIEFENYYSDHSSWHNPKGLEFKVSVPIITSRSCPFHCNFCTCYANMGRTFRRRDPKKVVDEIELLNQQYGQTYFRIVDDNFILIKKHVMDICHEIKKRNLDIQFETSCGLHISSLDEDLIASLAEAGCVFASLPIEHGNDKIRNIVIGKNLQRDTIYSTASLLKKYDILTSGSFVMGFPEDTKDTLEDTYRMINDLELDLNYVLTLMPFAGSKVFNQAVQDDLLTDKIDLDRLWEGNVLLDGLQDDHFFIKPYNMTIDELKVYRQKFNDMRIFSSFAKGLNQ